MITPMLAPVGNTPLVPCDRLAERLGLSRRIYAKLEQFNPGGSAKDRTARAMVEAAIADGRIDETTTPLLVESSSGNLGIALARQAHQRGWDFRCVVDPRANAASLATMARFGATIDMVNSPDAATGDWLTARRARVQALLQEYPQAINLDQYSNQAAFTAHAEGTMAEILNALDAPPEWLFVAVSTTGTLGGCQRKLREVGADTATMAVDAYGSILFEGPRATRVLPGFGAGVLPALAAHVHPTGVTRIGTKQAVIGAHALTRVEGILPGASGGAVIAALAHAVATGVLSPSGKRPVVVVLHDSGAGYLDSIYDPGWLHREVGITQDAIPQLVDALLAGDLGDYDRT
ncbi:pyridoxal-phosphate dependent enzyme [Corynebacterium choanae]|uniref:Putative siderophore biosynthesis protein SbnA n=1 Tax=Corynebacterium choanae TaxID=1862358 RepID=A0A3G6J7T1_9CORY|nr:pyridoxal-phosphate dependent enzyme [Corynebacterium choanae]AZA14165.1 putative siderophore biosynthesis protein SbnA [Corynebacterium choanae]